MKNIGSYLVGITALLVIISAACYEPIANTSDVSGSSREGGSDGDRIANENMNNTREGEISVQDNGPADAKKNDSADKPMAEGFLGNVSQNLSRHNLTIADVYDSSNAVENRIFNEYGAVFLTKAIPPAKVMFTGESVVSEFQTKAGVATTNIEGAKIELQSEAMKSLQEAIAEAKEKGIKITPRDGSEAGRRSYDKTLELWNDRFFKACDHWKSKGRLTAEQISQLKALPITEQVVEVLKLEKQGIYFNTFFNNSILYSVAAPGTSQHLSMLAFDANEFGNGKVRDIMARHGWFRTVQNDEPHFTYLGYPESDLPKLGLKKVNKKGGFWIPDI